MTYREFMEWVREENISLERLEIYPDRYTNVPFSSGCYQDDGGTWYYYMQIDERTKLTPNGRKMSEEECFEKLKEDVLYKIEKSR